MSNFEPKFWWLGWIPFGTISGGGGDTTSGLKIQSKAEGRGILVLVIGSTTAEAHVRSLFGESGPEDDAKLEGSQVRRPYIHVYN